MKAHIFQLSNDGSRILQCPWMSKYCQPTRSMYQFNCYLCQRLTSPTTTANRNFIVSFIYSKYALTIFYTFFNSTHWFITWSMHVPHHRDICKCMFQILHMACFNHNTSHMQSSRSNSFASNLCQQSLPAIVATFSHLRGNFSLFSFKIMSLARRKQPSLMLPNKFSSSSYFDGPQLL